MSTIPSPDAKAVVTAVAGLTTQVRRIADALSTPVVERTDATDDDATTTPDGPRCVCGDPIEQTGDPAYWIHSPGSDTPCLDANLVRPALAYRRTKAPAADEDAQRTARRAQLHNVLARLDRDGLLVIGERMLLRDHVEAEMREADQWRAGRNTMKQRGEDIEQDRDRIARQRDHLEELLRGETARANAAIDRETTADQAAEEAQARVRQLETAARRVLDICGDQGSDVQGILRAALDGTEQPTESS